MSTTETRLSNNQQSSRHNSLLELNRKKWIIKPQIDSCLKALGMESKCIHLNQRFVTSPICIAIMFYF